MKVKSTDDENDDIMDTSKILETAADIDDFTSTSEGETDMTAKKKAAAGSTKPQANEPKAAKKAAPAKKATKPASEKKGTFGPRTLPEGFVGITKLSEDSKLKPAVLRRKLRSLDGIEKHAEHGWAWKVGSKDYDKVLKAVTASAE